MKLTVVQKADPWYKDGLRFTCTQCGNCCTGGPGYVWLKKVEVERLAEHMKMTPEAFVRKYCRNVSGRLSLKEKIRDGLHDCIFLQPVDVQVQDNGQTRTETRRMCAVYPVRPLQCRTWPFWDGNLSSPAAWKRAGENCPGLGKGKLHKLDDIRRRLEIRDWMELEAQEKPKRKR